MNIGLFSDCYLPTRNGVSRAVHLLKSGLEAQGHRVVLVTVGYPGSSGNETPDAAALNPGAESSGISYFLPSIPFRPDIGLRTALTTPAAIRRIIIREKLDILHSHTEFSIGSAGRRAGISLGLPMVHTFHTLYEHYRHYIPLGPCIPKHLIRKKVSCFLHPYRAVICPSQKAQSYIRGCIGTDRTVHIPNGISRPPAALLEESRKDIPLLSSFRTQKIILYVGRLADEKRSIQLISLITPVLEKRRDCIFVLAGGGPQKRKIETLVRGKGLQGRIILPGFLPHREIMQLFGSAYLFVTAAVSENHPLSLLEACAAGLPVVARQDPGFTGIVEQNLNGFQTRTDSEFRQAVEKLLSDSPLRDRFGSRSRLIAGRFTLSGHIRRVEEVYRDCIGSCTGREGTKKKCEDPTG